MNETLHINVSNKVLVWARESLAFSRNQAVEKSKISARKLVQLETGELLPTLHELKILSRTYSTTLATLLLNAPPEGKPMPVDRRTVDSKTLGHFHEKTILAVRKSRAMAQAFVELRAEMGQEFAKFGLTASIKDLPQTVARNVRRSLHLNDIRAIKNINLALESYSERVESLGVAVFQLSLTQDNLRGFSIVDDVVPIIGIKRGNEQAHSKTFTLFHELGHLLLNEGGLCDLTSNSKISIEKWCNAFSAEVLVPTEEFLSLRSVLDHKREGQASWAKRDLVELADYFHVGPLTILRKLLQSGLTSEEFYRERHAAWNKPQFARAKTPEGRNIAREALKEKGRTYVGLAFKAYDQNKIDVKDLSDYLGVKRTDIDKTRQLLND
ncbi:MAG: ImmA/IrrE family metallo-endopeptidase [Ignavibacteria bacterium]|nr:ImmA/IrrE family metallo-endopeptidase [Ignavibacteria bacterium]